MNKNDVLNKLGRHEAHLMRQVEKTVQLRALRAERAMTIKRDELARNFSAISLRALAAAAWRSANLLPFKKDIGS